MTLCSLLVGNISLLGQHPPNVHLRPIFVHYVLLNFPTDHHRLRRYPHEKSTLVNFYDVFAFGNAYRAGCHLGTN